MAAAQPQKVYRYQSVSALTIESLCHDGLYFAAPAAFNDPHDCKPTVESDSEKETLRNILSELIKRRVAAETLGALKNARIQGAKAEAYAQRSGEQTARQELEDVAYNATNPEHGDNEKEAECWLLANEIQRELLMQYDRGVCCFSEVVDNPLLWSHYGDQHRGICIGYGLNRIPKPKLHKVVYGGSRTLRTTLIARALLEKEPEAQALLDRDVVLRKAPSWRYEREWRLLGERGAQASCLELVDLTFGLRCPGALKHALIKALTPKRANVKFFEMYEIRGSFKLKRKSVDIDELSVYFPKIAESGEEMFGPVLPKA